MYPKGIIKGVLYCKCTRKGLMETNMKLDAYIRDKRKLHNLTQQELAERAGVGYRFIRELESGKPTVRMDKVNQVLKLFGEELQPAKISN